MGNLTLSLADDVLQKAREAALREHTSINAVVREFLTHYADARARRTAALDVLDALAAANHSRSSAKGWTRESLQDRDG